MVIRALSANNAVCSLIGQYMESWSGAGIRGWCGMLSNRTINEIQVWYGRPRVCDIYEGEPNPKRKFYNRLGLPNHTAYLHKNAHLRHKNTNLRHL